MGTKKLKTILIGGVNSSLVTIQKLYEYDFHILMVYGFKPKNIKYVSSYCDLKPFCDSHNIPFQYYEKINDYETEIQNLNPDLLFVVGVSQLVSLKIIQSSKIGSIGFHPTKLPKGRGRAPIAWLVSECSEGASTFFVLEEEADSGGILDQEIFSIKKSFDAKKVEKILLKSIAISLDRLLPKIKENWWKPLKQNENYVSEYGIRKPEDGAVSWYDNAESIDRLIKAAAFPHPGAFTFYGMKKIKLIESEIEKNINIKGITGRVLKIQNEKCLVQSGRGLIWVKPENFHDLNIRIGVLFGYKIENEIFKIKNQIKKLIDLK